MEEYIGVEDIDRIGKLPLLECGGDAPQLLHYVAVKGNRFKEGGNLNGLVSSC